MRKFNKGEIKTPLAIKLTFIPFFVFIFLKIGASNTNSLIQITLVLFYFWLGSVLIIKPKTVFQVLREKHYFVLFIFILFLYFSYAFANGLIITIMGVGAQLQVLSPIFMYEFYSKFLSTKSQRYLIIITLCFYVYYSFQTVQYLESNPMAARDMISVGVSDSLLIGGGFSLAYGFSILIPILIYITINYTKFKENLFLNNLFTRTLLILLIVIFFVVVYKSMFAISFVIMIFAGMYVLLKMNINKKTNNIKIFVFLLISFFGFITVNQLKSFLYNYLDSLNSVISDKLVIILNLSDNGNLDSTSSLGVRLELYLQSFYTWLDNPFLGIGYLYEYNTARMIAAGLGNHSEWLDLLAKHGIFAVLSFAYLFMPKKTYVNKQGFNLSIKIFLIAGFLNPIYLFNIFFVVYFFAPLLDDYFFSSKKT